MRITSVKIKKIENLGGIMAEASIVLDDEICIHNIYVVKSKNGYFISFPHKKDKNGKYIDFVHPTNAETREKIQKAILTEYEELSKQG